MLYEKHVNCITSYLLPPPEKPIRKEEKPSNHHIIFYYIIKSIFQSWSVRGGENYSHLVR